MASKPFRVVCAFDTETTTIRNGVNSHAFVCLYIFNDLRRVDLRKYEPDKDEEILFYRDEQSAQDFLDELVKWGLDSNCVPVVCAYNLMFDMQTLIYDLNKRYNMVANAQSSTHVYTLDCLDSSGNVILRFWDTYHLEMRGLAAMGKSCGIKKAEGDWDYTLIRTQETPLTEKELFYAKRDVQVIPAYLSYLLSVHEWLQPEFFGLKVITKTSLVRQMAVYKISRLKVKKQTGKKLDLGFMFGELCKKELPIDYESYALRKACFRGGFTFTAGKTANKVVHNVCSLDVTSMHHLFINGRRIPQDFVKCDKEALTFIVKNTVKKSLSAVLHDYDWPFYTTFHCCVTYTNIRLKKGSAFEAYQIGLIPMDKFRVKIDNSQDYVEDERSLQRENEVRANGFVDFAKNAVFAFGKLYEAELCVIHVNELEAWTIAQVYDYDSLSVEYGEATAASKIPPDYVTLQSNMLFNMKSDCKKIESNYTEGEPYKYDIPDFVPNGIRDELKTGECEREFFRGYYNGTIKGMFNGIYGVMAQDVFKPRFLVENGKLSVDQNDKLNYDNYDEHLPDKCKVLYTYGMRIVGGSRMHLCIAIILLFNKFGERIDILGGDTDSLKIRCDEDVTNEDLLEALEPLHNAAKFAIDENQKRLRKLFPDYASPLTHIGQFEIESCAGFPRYKNHMEAWNKARISEDENGKTHITCAGLSRPIGAYTIEDFSNDFLKIMSAEELFPLLLGYNTNIAYDLCYGLERTQPKPESIFDSDIVDYLGNKTHVHSHEAISLYESPRTIGSTLAHVNFYNVHYLEKHGTDVDWSVKELYIKDGKCIIEIGGEKAYECLASI